MQRGMAMYHAKEYKDVGMNEEKTDVPNCLSCSRPADRKCRCNQTKLRIDGAKTTDRMTAVIQARKGLKNKKKGEETKTRQGQLFVEKRLMHG